MHWPAQGVTAVSAKGRVGLSPPLPVSEGGTARVGSPAGARPGRRQGPGGRRRAAARLLALLAPALLVGCGYTEFEWQAQLDKIDRLQRDLQSSEQRIRRLEEQASRPGAAAPVPGDADRLDVSGIDPGASAQRGEPAGARPEPDSAVLRAFQPLATGEITVAPRDGDVVISIPTRLLFKGNRDALSAAGEKALRELAAIVRGSEPLQALGYHVVGHTVSGAPTVAWRNGWDVTVARARAVMLFLAQPKEAGLPTARLSLASFADLPPADAAGGAPAQPPDPRLEIVVSGTAQEAGSPGGEARPDGGARPGAGAAGRDDTYP
ncbi:hypothetical protein WMF31_27115 [Sorangium sp. So ce1036]|uniref:OmpA/MotB family protein n=1 Tax=Sorangium sp. So ce1036 TaxID=3133328 RepID=UPI003EFC16CD